MKHLEKFLLYLEGIYTYVNEYLSYKRGGILHLLLKNGSDLKA
jgi:hypothetical protein